MYSEEKKFLPLYITRFSISLGITALLTYVFVEEDEARITGFTFRAHITNRRIQSLAWFRSFYAFSVMMVRIYIPVFARLALSLSAFQSEPC